MTVHVKTANLCEQGRGKFKQLVGPRGSKMSVFVHAQGMKTVHAGGSKNGKILST